MSCKLLSKGDFTNYFERFKFTSNMDTISKTVQSFVIVEVTECGFNVKSVIITDLFKILLIHALLYPKDKDIRVFRFNAKDALHYEVGRTLSQEIFGVKESIVTSLDIPESDPFTVPRSTHGEFSGVTFEKCIRIYINMICSKQLRVVNHKALIKQIGYPPQIEKNLKELFNNTVLSIKKERRKYYESMNSSYCSLLKFFINSRADESPLHVFQPISDPTSCLTKKGFYPDPDDDVGDLNMDGKWIDDAF